jgi:hypothetical protein
MCPGKRRSTHKKRYRFLMNKSTRLIITAAAITGLYAGSLASKSFAAESAGKADSKQDSKEKASCKGKNDCKGKGGCGSSDNGCKGKNSCKGKGGCAAHEEKKA